MLKSDCNNKITRKTDTQSNYFPQLLRTIPLGKKTVVQTCVMNEDVQSLLKNKGCGVNYRKFYARFNSDLKRLDPTDLDADKTVFRLKIWVTAMWLILRNGHIGMAEMGCLRKINSLNSVLLLSGFSGFSTEEVFSQERQNVLQAVENLLS